ncbi:MAG: hypothetical protein U5J63_13500 [Fodinibius sp.]|nr:hypothetical protein [Fodinibius sp.]
MEAGTGTVALFVVSLFMIVVALTLLVAAIKKGFFNSVHEDAYIPFSDDEPVGKPTDQLFADDNQSVE